MVWNDLKYDLENKYRPRTKRALKKSIKKFWRKRVTTNYCNKKIDKLYKVVDRCIILNRMATGF